MKLFDLPRTTSFRLALRFLALFGFASVVLMAFLYWRTAGYIVSSADEWLAREAAGLADVSREELVRDLRNHVARDPENRRPFGAFEANGTPIAGNLTIQPSTLRLDRSFEFTETVDGVVVPFRGRASRLPTGLHVVVSQNVRELHSFYTVLVGAMASGGVAVLVIGLAGALVTGAGSVRRIDRLTRSIERIIAGDLAERLPNQGTADDIDRLVQVINKMLGRSERLMHEVKGVCDGIAHDLRTPLTRLLGGLERAQRRRSTPEDYALIIGEAIEETKGILTTFASLLRISEIEDGARRAGFAPVDLERIARDAAEFYEPMAEERAIAITIDVKDTPRPALMGDASLLFEAVGNLLDNAIKFSPEGSRIRIAVACEADTWISVADNGPGIPAEDRETVMLRFGRADRTGLASGSGLGLSIVAAIASLHDLHLSIVDATPGCRISLSS